MTRSYDRTYLQGAQSRLGRMFDFALNTLRMNRQRFWEQFLASGIAGRFGRGDVSLVAGRSGVELVYEMLNELGMPIPKERPQFPADRSPEYWAGWILAYAQWWTGLSFREIGETVPLDLVIADYDVYHEMDQRQWVDRLVESYRKAHPTARLQSRRLAVGMSQSELAEKIGISVRTLQRYEQRQKDLSRAAFDTVRALGQALNCAPESLIEISAPEDELSVKR